MQKPEKCENTWGEKKIALLRTLISHYTTCIVLNKLSELNKLLQLNFDTNHKSKKIFI